jgi:hypothetical protein
VPSEPCAFRLWIYAEVVVTVVMGGGATVWAIKAHQSSVTLLAVWVWMSLLAAWLFRLMSDWNDFTGAAVATGAYLNTLLRRRRSSLRAAQFGGILFFSQLVVTSAWVFRELNSQSPVNLSDYLARPANLIFAIGAIVFYVWLIVYWRKLRNEIAELEELKTQFGEEIAIPSLEPQFTIRAAIAHFASRIERLKRKKLRGY